MRKLLLTLGFLLGGCLAAQAQVPCIGVGGVNSVPQAGVTCQQPPAVNSFVASSVGIAPASSATDLICLTGKAGAVVRVQRITVSGTAGTAINVPFSITKNATADTAGTQATGTALPVPYSIDPNVAATVAVATFQANTTNPTINDAAPGIIDTRSANLPTTAAGSGSNVLAFEFSNVLAEQPTLRSVAQQVCLNLNSTTISTGKINTGWWWTESPQ